MEPSKGKPYRALKRKKKNKRIRYREGERKKRERVVRVSRRISKPIILDDDVEAMPFYLHFGFLLSCNRDFSAPPSSISQEMPPALFIGNSEWYRCYVIESLSINFWHLFNNSSLKKRSKGMEIKKERSQWTLVCGPPQTGFRYQRGAVMRPHPSLIFSSHPYMRFIFYYYSHPLIFFLKFGMDKMRSVMPTKWIVLVLSMEAGLNDRSCSSAFIVKLVRIFDPTSFIFTFIL